MIGMFKSSATPITSLLRINGSSGTSCKTAVFLPPVQRNAPSKPNEYKSSPTPLPPHFLPPPGYGTYPVVLAHPTYFEEKQLRKLCFRIWLNFHSANTYAQMRHHMGSLFDMIHCYFKIPFLICSRTVNTPNENIWSYAEMRINKANQNAIQ